MKGSKRKRYGSALTHWLVDTITSPVVYMPGIVLIATLMLFIINAEVFRAQLYSAQWYDLYFSLSCLAPAACSHVMAYHSVSKSLWWWALWLPGLVWYWMRPWVGHDGLELYWMRLDYIWGHTKALFWASWFNRPLPSGSLSTVLSVFLIATAMLACAARPVLALSHHYRSATDPKSETGSGTVEGLPQARWADISEIKHHFSHKGGIVLGELTDPIDTTPDFDPADPLSWKQQGKGRLITMDPNRGNGHVVVITASAGGKTAGIIVPNILHYAGPLVVIDPKGDLYARTKDAREAMGYTARVINAENGFDPFKLVAPLAASTPSVYLTMAKTLMPLSARSSDISEYFHEMSCSLFAALMAYFIDQNSSNVARDISRFINQSRDDVIEAGTEIASRYQMPLITDEMKGLAALDERTFPGVVKSIANKLAFVRFPDVAAYGSSSHNAADHLRALEPRTDIFINIPTLSVKDFASFLRLLIGAMYVATELLEHPDRPQARRLFLIDEARVLGGMDALTNVRDAGRSIGMHLMLIYQSLGQLKEAWGGEAGADAWLDSCEARVVGAVGAARTAQDIVTMLGRRTIETRTRGTSSSSKVTGLFAGSVSSSASTQLREVSLMSAATLGRLPAHGSVIFTRRTHPILGTKALYFTRKDMADHVKSPEDVTKELDVTKRREKVINALKETKNKKANATPKTTTSDIADITAPNGRKVASDTEVHEQGTEEKIEPALSPVPTEAAPVSTAADISTTTLVSKLSDIDPGTLNNIKSLVVQYPALFRSDILDNISATISHSDEQDATDPMLAPPESLADSVTIIEPPSPTVQDAAKVTPCTDEDEIKADIEPGHESSAVPSGDDIRHDQTKKDPEQSSQTSAKAPISASDLRPLLEMRARDLFEKTFGPLKKEGAHSVRVAHDTSISMTFESNKYGQWHHHKAGFGGDLFDLVAIGLCGRPIVKNAARHDFPQVLQMAAHYVGYHQHDQTYHTLTAKAQRARMTRKTAQAASEAQRKKDKQELITTLQRLALPLHDTPAETYLKSRHIMQWPVSGLNWLPSLDDHLSPTQKTGVLHAQYGALVVWAENEHGVITGGQRILLNPDGKKADVSASKPSFGSLTHSAGRFLPFDDQKDHPLVVAEGPETALSIWLTAGIEVWAVFGVSGFQSAPLPENKRIILAPDQDDPTSVAAGTFRKAAEYHQANGKDILIAVCPEQSGSKRDFNDTLLRLGIEPVRDALKKACPLSDFYQDT